MTNRSENTIMVLTRPHIKLKNEMISNGLYDGFQTSKKMYQFEIDEYNHDLQLCLEIDGDYWHNYPYGTQQDKRKNTFLANKGFTVLRIWEHDINTNLGGCIEKIKETIECLSSQVKK